MEIDKSISQRLDKCLISFACAYWNSRLIAAKRGLHSTVNLTSRKVKDALAPFFNSLKSLFAIYCRYLFYTKLSENCSLVCVHGNF